MRLLGEVEIRCAKHPNLDLTCEVCHFMMKTEEEIQLIKGHRLKVVKEIEKKLASRELIMVGLR